MTATTIPIHLEDPVNQAILAVSEDRLEGFQRDPFGTIAETTGIPVDTVLERTRALLEAGVIRRIRQTLMATNLAPGALVAWQLPAEALHSAFDFLFEQDPFSGHVVIRTTDSDTPGSKYRLWTTLKVPQGYSLEKHAAYLANTTGATSFRPLPLRPGRWPHAAQAHRTGRKDRGAGPCH